MNLKSGENEIKFDKFILNKELLEKEGFEMNRAIKVFKEVDTDGSGTIDILEFLN